MLKNIASYLSPVDVGREMEKDKMRLGVIIAVEIALIAATLVIQEYARPKTVLNSQTGRFLLGILPSFFGAMAYVLILFVGYKIVQGHHGKFSLPTGLLLANGISFFGLTLWEVIRMVIRPFDAWDVLASLGGCVGGTLLILGMYAREHYRRNKKPSAT